MIRRTTSGWQLIQELRQRHSAPSAAAPEQFQRSDANEGEDGDLDSLGDLHSLESLDSFSSRSIDSIDSTHPLLARSDARTERPSEPHQLSSSTISTSAKTSSPSSMSDSTSRSSEEIVTDREAGNGGDLEVVHYHQTTNEQVSKSSSVLICVSKNQMEQHGPPQSSQTFPTTLETKGATVPERRYFMENNSTPRKVNKIENNTLSVVTTSGVHTKLDDDSGTGKLLNDHISTTHVGRPLRVSQQDQPRHTHSRGHQGGNANDTLPKLSVRDHTEEVLLTKNLGGPEACIVAPEDEVDRVSQLNPSSTTGLAITKAVTDTKNTHDMVGGPVVCQLAPDDKVDKLSQPNPSSSTAIAVAKATPGFTITQGTPSTKNVEDSVYVVAPEDKVDIVSQNNISSSTALAMTKMSPEVKVTQDASLTNNSRGLVMCEPALDDKIDKLSQFNESSSNGLTVTTADPDAKITQDLPMTKNLEGPVMCEVAHDAEIDRVGLFKPSSSTGVTVTNADRDAKITQDVKSTKNTLGPVAGEISTDDKVDMVSQYNLSSSTMLAVLKGAPGVKINTISQFNPVVCEVSPDSRVSLGSQVSPSNQGPCEISLVGADAKVDIVSQFDLPRGRAPLICHEVISDDKLNMVSQFNQSNDEAPVTSKPAPGVKVDVTSQHTPSPKGEVICEVAPGGRVDMVSQFSLSSAADTAAGEAARGEKFNAVRQLGQSSSEAPVSGEMTEDEEAVMTSRFSPIRNVFEKCKDAIYQAGLQRTVCLHEHRDALDYWKILNKAIMIGVVSWLVTQTLYFSQSSADERTFDLLSGNAAESIGRVLFTSHGFPRFINERKLLHDDIVGIDAGHTLSSISHIANHDGVLPGFLINALNVEKPELDTAFGPFSSSGSDSARNHGSVSTVEDKSLPHMPQSAPNGSTNVYLGHVMHFVTGSRPFVNPLKNVTDSKVLDDEVLHIDAALSLLSTNSPAVAGNALPVPPNYVPNEEKAQTEHTSIFVSLLSSDSKPAHGVSSTSKKDKDVLHLENGTLNDSVLPSDVLTDTLTKFLYNLSQTTARMIPDDNSTMYSETEMDTIETKLNLKDVTDEVMDATDDRSTLADEKTACVLSKEDPGENNSTSSMHQGRQHHLLSTMTISKGATGSIGSEWKRCTSRTCKRNVGIKARLAESLLGFIDTYVAMVVAGDFFL